MKLSALACRFGWWTHRVSAIPTDYSNGRLTLARVCNRCGKNLGTRTYDRRHLRG